MIEREAECSCGQLRLIAEGEPRTYHFCPECGATVYYVLGSAPEVVAVPVGGFGDPNFPTPRISIWESRKHEWVEVPPHIDRHR